MDIEHLSVAHVQDQLRTGKVSALSSGGSIVKPVRKFHFPGSRDSQGRPIIIYNSCKHDTSVDFLETLKVAVYMLETTINE